VLTQKGAEEEAVRRHAGAFMQGFACMQVLPQVQQPRTGINEGVKVGLIGIGALILLGGAFFLGRKLLSSQLPKVQKVCPSALHNLEVCPWAADPTQHSREKVADQIGHLWSSCYCLALQA